MKTVYPLVALLLALVTSEDVVTLTTSNFKDTIESSPFVLVEFYAPWCGHCKKLAPEYEKAAADAKKLDPPIVLAKVDATTEAELATEFGVKGYPTLKWFVNGKVSDYNGGRTADTIVQWVQKKTGPAAKVITSVDELKAFQEAADAVVVGFFADDSEAKTFLAHAGTDDTNHYAICYGTCSDLKSHAGVKAEKKLAVLQNFDDGKAEFDGDHTEQTEIATFVAANVLPIIVPFSQETAPKIFNGEITTQMLLFVEAQDDPDALKLFNEAKPVAKTFTEKLLFVSVAKSDAKILEFFGVNEEDLPTIRIVKMDPSGVQKFKFTANEITSATLEQFANDYFEGKVMLDLKTEEPLPESEQGNVRVVVGKDFVETVYAEGKDVLVEFYAPWCGHCKKLEPEYNKVGEHFKDNPNIVIAKMDSTTNEVEEITVSGFPTLKFFPADKKEIMDYDGSRDADGIIKYLEKNAQSLK